MERILIYKKPGLWTLIVFFIFISFNCNIYSQQYGNEWINYSQPYYRFKVYQDGIYRINYATLDSALQQNGIQLSNVAPVYFQVWGRGEQQPIFIQTGSDGLFNSGDYIEFYGRKNDGYYDSLIYDHPLSQVNPYVSLFNDTACYFFSFNASGNNSRMITEVTGNYSSYQPLTYVWWTNRLVFRETYSSGERFTTSDPATTICNAAYTTGEGITAYGFGINGTQTRQFPVNHVFSQGPPAVFSFAAFGGSSRITVISKCHLKCYFQNLPIADTNLLNYQVGRFSATIPNTQINNQTPVVQFSNISLPGQDGYEWMSVPFLALEYARTPDFTNILTARFQIPQLSAQPFQYLRISNYNLTTGDTLRLYDLKNHKRIIPVQNGGFFHFLIPNTSGVKDCYLAGDLQSINVKSLKPVGQGTGFFQDFSSAAIAANCDYLIVTHDTLIQAASSYADYRLLNGAPQKFKPVLTGISDLYDQFAHGIEKNPLAIRNFARYCLSHFTNRPKYLFVIGKSYCPSNFQFNSWYSKYSLVPSFGSPPSDWMFTFGIEAPNEIAIPVGRLSAYDQKDIYNYLDKVSLYEQNNAHPNESAKNVLNFGGGSNSFEQDVFAYFLNQYSQKLRNPYFGGNVRTFLKTSPDPVQVNQTEYLRNAIENEGVGIINYFGHASGVSFDMSIGDPGDFNNSGKYYFVLANSCWAGDIFDYHSGLSSERYVLLKNKGAIAFLGSVSEGEPLFLNEYSRNFYEELTNLNYGKSIGTIISQGIHKLLIDTLHTSFSYTETCLEFALHGDPSLVLNPTPFPDYDIKSSVITPNRLFFSPSRLTNEIDSFNLILVPSNNGKALDTSFFIRITRETQAALLMDTLIRIKAPYFRDTISVKLPILSKIATGINTFRIYLNALNEIDENGVTANNDAVVSIDISTNNVIPVYPYKYSVVPVLPVKLYASVSSSLQGVSDYIFQLDTTDLFNSPVLLDTIITHSGGVICWTPNPTITTDSTVYYWRCAVKSLNPDSLSWEESSFQYIHGKKGWSQAHFYQFSDNNYQYIKYLRDSLRFVFVQDYKTVFASTFLTGHPWQDEIFKLNGNVLDVWSCAHTACNNSCGLKFAVFDPVSFRPLISVNQGNGLGQYGNKHCRNYPLGAFDFCTFYPSDRELIRHFIDTIPVGYYFLAFSHFNHHAQEFEESVYQAFESIGSQYIRTINDTCSYIIFGRKGDPIGSAVEAGMNSARDSLVRINVSVPTNWNEGVIESVPVGPARKWESLHWQMKQSLTDSVRLTVLGIRNNGSLDTLIGGLTEDSTDVYGLETRIDANIYPYLKLVLHVKDTASNPPLGYTPPQLKRWQLLFEGIPETAADPFSGFSFHADTLDQGDRLKMSLAFHNISELDMDSLLVTYWLNHAGENDTILTHRLRPHPAGDILIDSISFSTNHLKGDYTFWVEANPHNDQPETYHFNNYTDLPFYVKTDNINPVLDVRFDGIHIMNGDYVSATPKIEIRLNDENKYIPLNDTSLFTIYTSKSTADLKRVYFNSGSHVNMKFFPAVLPENACMVSYNPVYTEDGTYQLSVQARDSSGNLSGVNPYHIYYKVEGEPGVTALTNYPNPFTDYTWFSFVLTGKEVPDDYSIRIFDLSGRLVKEITKEEFGPIHIGTNQGRIPWYGYGDNGFKLSAGVYITDLVMKVKGDNVPENSAIQSVLTKKTIHNKGKLVLIK